MTTAQKAGGGGAAIVIAGALLLAVLHQDWWWWDTDTLVFGTLPTGLAFHALYSILAASLWAFACVFAWPASFEEIESVEDGDEPTGASA